MVEFAFAGDVISAVKHEECHAIAELAVGERVLEIGSHYGRSTIALASVASIVHSIDWHRGDPHAGSEESLSQFIDNLRKYNLRDKVVIHVGRIEDVAPVLARSSFDGAFIDGFHEKSAVERDTYFVRPLVRSGGWMAFHDYGVSMISNGVPFGVTEAVDQFADKLGLRVSVVSTLAYIRIP